MQSLTVSKPFYESGIISSRPKYIVVSKIDIKAKKMSKNVVYEFMPGSLSVMDGWVHIEDYGP